MEKNDFMQIYHVFTYQNRHRLLDMNFLLHSYSKTSPFCHKSENASSQEHIYLLDIT